MGAEIFDDNTFVIPFSKLEEESSNTHVNEITPPLHNDSSKDKLSRAPHLEVNTNPHSTENYKATTASSNNYIASWCENHAI